MSTFSKASYQSANYLALRPHYPQKFYQFLKAYAGAVDVAVDVGCGPGEAAVHVADFSKQVYALDPSEGMIKSGRAANVKPNVTFEVGSDTTLLDRFGPKSVDLITCAESAHWFKYPEFLNNAAKILRPGGTLAIWGYVDWSIAGKQSVLDNVIKYTYDDEYLGFHSASPGRDILRNLYQKLLPLPKEFTDVQYHTSLATNPLSDDEPLELTWTAPLRDVGNYMRTYSQFHNWKEKHPEATPENDVIAELINEISRSEGIKLDDEVTIKWNTVYLLARKA